MFMCRACAKRWRGPPTALFAVPSAVRQAQRVPIESSFSPFSQSSPFSTTSRAPAASSIRSRINAKPLRPRQQHAERKFGTAKIAEEKEEDGLLDDLEDYKEEEEEEEEASDYVSGKAKRHKSFRETTSTSTSGNTKLSKAEAKADAVLLRKAKQRLQYLKDAYNIAEATNAMLKKNEYDEALTMVRLASKRESVVVSWNLLIGHLMAKDRLGPAIKLYNEMKKRGQLPNGQTYTTIFSGCAHSRHPDQGVFHATRLYHSMLANERFPPNKIHMNAVLNVCGRARDIESMFSIAATADTKTRVPDSVTYGTILNGLRYATIQPHHRPSNSGSNEDGEDVEKVFIDKELVKTSVARARALWTEVVKNWHSGTLMIDDKLVGAMGRVLLMGSVNDNDDILSLVEQTTGLQRLDRTPLGQVAAPTAPKTAKTEGAESNEESKEETNREVHAPPPPPRETQFTNGNKKVGFVAPNNNILSLIMSSLGTTKKTSLAMPYWELLTGPQYGVKPDSENYFRLLKTLRRGRASKKTAEIIEQMPRNFLEPKTFQLAMATCASDNLNDNVFQSAGKILDVMVRTLNEPDPYTMRMYLQTTMTNNRRFREEKDPAKRDAAKMAFGSQIVRALRRLWDPLRRAGNTLSYPAKPFSSPEAQHKATYNARRELMALARAMVSAADMVVTELMADAATIKDLTISRNLLNRQVTRFYDRREEYEPALKKSKRGGARNEEGRRWDGEKKEDEKKEDEKRGETSRDRRREKRREMREATNEAAVAR